MLCPCVFSCRYHFTNVRLFLLACHYTIQYKPIAGLFLAYIKSFIPFLFPLGCPNRWTWWHWPELQGNLAHEAKNFLGPLRQVQQEWASWAASEGPINDALAQKQYVEQSPFNMIQPLMYW